MEGKDVRPGQVKPAQVAAGIRSAPSRPRGYAIKLSDVSYFATKPRSIWNSLSKKGVDKKLILQNVTCEAKPGRVVAVAGPSGAGKSTLLEVLSGRVHPQRGSVLLNGVPSHPGRLRRMSGFVTQEDALFPLLTVEETLMFSARLRLPSCVPYAEKAARVRVLIGELGLAHVARSRVGRGDGGQGGISGGERRRVSIGVDIVHDPAVLILDEPTSGLDSASALQVAGLLKSMAETHGRSIVLSIHQPGYRILEMFDQLVLLFDGCVVHHGSMVELRERLAAFGHCIPLHINVLEYAIDAIHTLNNKRFHDNAVSAPRPWISHKEEKALYANNMVKETAILTQRFCKNVVRTKELFMGRTKQSLIAGLALGSIFINSKPDERLGFFAFSLTFLLSSTTEGLPIFLEERAIVTTETSRGAYRVSSYVAANTLVFMPFLLVVAVLYAAPVYWMIGLFASAAAFMYFVMVVWMVLFMANSFVACMSALAPDFIMGNSLIAGLMGSFFLFSGYFIAKDNIPKYWIFMHYLSLFKYPFESFLINEYSHLGSACFQSTGGVCVMDGNGFLNDRGLHSNDLWHNVLVMAIFTLVYRLLGFFILSFRCSNGRRFRRL